MKYKYKTEVLRDGEGVEISVGTIILDNYSSMGGARILCCLIPEKEKPPAEPDSRKELDRLMAKNFGEEDSEELSMLLDRADYLPHPRFAFDKEPEIDITPYNLGVFLHFAKNSDRPVIRDALAEIGIEIVKKEKD